MEKIVLKSTGLDIEQHIDAVAAYIRGNGYPRFDHQLIDFHCVELEWQSLGWMISEIERPSLLNTFKCQYGWTKTRSGIPFDPEYWNMAAFEVDGHYYFMDK